MRFENFILAAIVTLAITSCGCRSVSNTLADVESYIQDRPDSALTVLNGIDVDKILTPARKARFSLLYAMALDKNYIDTTDINVIKPAADYFRKHGSPDERLKALYYEGRIYFNAQEYTNAIASYSEALPDLERARDLKSCGMLCRDIGVTYNKTYGDEEPVKYVQMAQKYFHDGGCLIHEIDAFFLIAQDYFNIDKFDEARDALAQIGLIDVDGFYKYKVQALMAHMLTSVEPKDYEKSVALFSEIIDSTGTLPMMQNWGAYAYALDKIGREKDSEAVFDSLLKMDNPEAEKVYHGWKLDVYNDNADYQKALEESQMVNKINQEINKFRMKESSAKAQRDFFEAQNSQMAAKSKSDKLHLWLVICLLTIALTVVYAIFKARNLAEVREKNRFAELAETVKVQLSQREQKLSGLRAEYARMYKEKFSMIGTLCETYYRYADSNDPQKHVYEKVESLLKDIVEDRKGQARFEKMINESLDNIMVHFRVDFPKFEEEDYRFVSYIFAGFDAITLLVILGMPSQGAVYSKKNRIKNSILKSDSEYKDFYIDMLS